MVCEAKEGFGFYRPRQPRETPFYKLVARFYPEFERVYAERTQERYGFWRSIIARAVERFLDCGDLKKGFARVRCPKSRHESFVEKILECFGLSKDESHRGPRQVQGRTAG